MKKISLCAVLIIMANFAYANDLTKTENYYPDGKYGIGSRFARKNPTIEKVKNNVRLTVHSYDNGPIHMDIHKYGGGIYFERRFEDHPLSEHGGWSRPPVTQQVNDFHGSIENGKLGVTNAKIYGVEMHPNDAYDAKDGGDHPYDIYTFTVDGESRYTSIREVEKPKPLPTPPNNPYNPNANNDNGNRQAENGSNDNNSRENQTRQEQANGQGGNDALTENGELKQPQDTGSWQDTLTGAWKYLNKVRIQMQYPNTHLGFPDDVVKEHAGQDVYNNPPEKQYQVDSNNSWEQAGQTGAEWIPALITRNPASLGNKADDLAETAAKKAEQLAKNKAKGSQFEKSIGNEYAQDGAKLTPQVTLKTDSGIKTRPDFVGVDKNGKLLCIECKSSPTAPLTKNQKKAFPEIEKNGATVVGKGTPEFPAGTRFPPTKPTVVRPNSN